MNILKVSFVISIIVPSLFLSGCSVGLFQGNTDSLATISIGKGWRVGKMPDQRTVEETADSLHKNGQDALIPTTQ